MRSERKSYTNLVESNVLWLGKVPQHWDIVPHRAVFTEVNKRDLSDEEMLSVTISRGVIRQSALLSDTSKKDSSNEDKSKYKLVCPDDLVYNKMRAWQGAVGVSKYRGIVSPAYIVMRTRKQQAPRYFHYLYRTPMFAKEAERWSYGITSDMWSLRSEHFKIIYTCIPPIPEQAAIVRYLDYMDRNIKKYIRAKQKLIKLLEEQKQAIIHQAVTQGFNPDVPMKPSGVEWLGDVPAHWEMKKLKYIVNFSGGGTPSKGIESYWKGHIPWVSPKDMQGSLVVDTEDHITEEAVANSATSIVQEGCVLIVVRSGILRRKIPVAINAVNVALNQDMKALKPKSVIEANYLLALIQGNQFALINEWTKQGATVESVEYSLMANSIFAVPPKSEQRSIVDFVNRACSEVEEVIRHAKSEISLLLEYRTRLIADVVTGKVDVREIAASLPDLDEADILEEAVLDDEVVDTDKAGFSEEVDNK